METICNWNGFPKVKSKVLSPKTFQEVSEMIKGQRQLIARGNGRSYSDNSLQRKVLSLLKINSEIKLDIENQTVLCNSGVLLIDVLKVIVPKGFFLPVTPGTKFITIGGAIASNVHGKNHFIEGSIAKYIKSMLILTETGKSVLCTRNRNTALFESTIGGLGLTGVILEATIQLKEIETSYILQEKNKAKNLEELLALFEKNKGRAHTVAWIDCFAKNKSLGKGILSTGKHIEKNELPQKFSKEPLKLHENKQINLPFYIFPKALLNKFTIKVFNAINYNLLHKKKSRQIVHYNNYFYPLDKIENWNEAYGNGGFIQYQFVIPFCNGKEGIKAILNAVQESNCGVCLAVLKRLGKEECRVSSLSFPMEGFTLALDVKNTNSSLKLLCHLDELIIKFKGRIYLSKDCRMTASTFNRMYPEKTNHNSKFVSMLSNRLGI